MLIGDKIRGKSIKIVWTCTTMINRCKKFDKIHLLTIHDNVERLKITMTKIIEKDKCVCH